MARNYTSIYEEHEDGDTWVYGGKEYTQKNGERIEIGDKDNSSKDDSSKRPKVLSDEDLDTEEKVTKAKQDVSKDILSDIKTLDVEKIQNLNNLGLDSKKINAHIKKTQDERKNNLASKKKELNSKIKQILIDDDVDFSDEKELKKAVEKAKKGIKKELSAYESEVKKDIELTKDEIKAQKLVSKTKPPKVKVNAKSQKELLKTISSNKAKDFDDSEIEKKNNEIKKADAKAKRKANDEEKKKADDQAKKDAEERNAEYAQQMKKTKKDFDKYDSQIKNKESGETLFKFNKLDQDKEEDWNKEYETKDSIGKYKMIVDRLSKAMDELKNGKSKDSARLGIGLTSQEKDEKYDFEINRLKNKIANINNLIAHEQRNKKESRLSNYKSIYRLK